MKRFLTVTLALTLFTTFLLAFSLKARAQEPFLGEIRMFAGNFAPRGWALCNGQLLPINQNQALFSLLGTMYGGDGKTTFALPNLQGRVPIHMGQGLNLTPRFQGEAGGEEEVILTISEIPQHNHQAIASNGEATELSPAGNVWATKSRTTLYNKTGNVAMSNSAIGMAGGNQPHNNMPPYLTINFIIALQGIYPSRD